MSKLKLPAKMESLESFRSFVLDLIQCWHLDSAATTKVELILEELLTNIIQYAYPPCNGPNDQGEGIIELDVKLEEDGKVKLIIQDWGVPFDPADQGEPDLTCALEEREVGGLGIFLIRKMVDELHYRREGVKNVLTVLLRVK